MLLVFEQHFFFLGKWENSLAFVRPSDTFEGVRAQGDCVILTVVQARYKNYSVLSVEVVVVGLFTTHTVKAERKRIEMSWWEKSEKIY